MKSTKVDRVGQRLKEAEYNVPNSPHPCCATCRFLKFTWTDMNAGRCAKNDFTVFKKYIHGVCKFWKL